MAQRVGKNIVVNSKRIQFEHSKSITFLFRSCREAFRENEAENKTISMRIATMIVGRDDDYVSLCVFVLLREKCMNSYVYTSIYRKREKGATKVRPHETYTKLHHCYNMRAHFGEFVGRRIWARLRVFARMLRDLRISERE